MIPSRNHERTLGVYLAKTSSRRRATEILLVSHQYATIRMEIKWISETHLDIGYGPSTRPGDQTAIDFEVSRCLGVDVTVEPFAAAEH